MKYFYTLAAALLSLSVYAQLPRWDWFTDCYTSTGSHHYIREITSDSAGNLYLCGRHNGWIVFPDKSSPMGNSEDGYLVKLNRDGTYAWGIGEGGRADDTDLQSMDLDSQDRLAYGGFFEGTEVIGGKTLNSTGGTVDGYLIARDTSNQIKWQKTFTGSAGVQTIKVRCDNNDNIVASGYFDKQVKFAINHQLNSGTESNFAISYDPNGNVQWKRSFDLGVWIYEMELDNQGDVSWLVRGSVNDTFNLDGTILPPVSNSDFAIVHFDRNGLKWAVRAGSPSSLGMVMRQQGDFLYLGGTVQDSLTFDGQLLKSSSTEEGYILKLDSNGQIVDQRFFPAPITSMDAGSNGLIYCGGRYSGSISMDGHTVSNTSGNSTFFIEFSEQLQANWIESIGNDSRTSVPSISARSRHYLHFVSGLNGDVLIGDTTVVDHGFNSYIFGAMLYNELWDGVPTVELSDMLKVYPNPVQHELIVANNGLFVDGTFTLTSITGQVVQQEAMALPAGEQIVVDVSTLKAGVYFYTIDNGRESVTHKLMKL